jgi:hypothetical protein
VNHSHQAELFRHLQALASGSHQRAGERRVFTAAQAAKWAGCSGWEVIQAAMHTGQLPIITPMGPNSENVEEYRFGEQGTGRLYHYAVCLLPAVITCIIYVAIYMKNRSETDIFYA